jgi:hypothetical protein
VISAGLRVWRIRGLKSWGLFICGCDLRRAEIMIIDEGNNCVARIRGWAWKTCRPRAWLKNPRHRGLQPSQN